MSDFVEPASKQQIWCFVNMPDSITSNWIGAAKRMAPVGLKIVFKSTAIQSLTSKPPINVDSDQATEVSSDNFAPAAIVIDLHGTGTLANALSLPHTLDDSTRNPDSNRPIYVAWLSNADANQKALLMEMGYDFIVERMSEIPRIVPKLLQFGRSTLQPSHPWLEDAERSTRQVPRPSH